MVSGRNDLMVTRRDWQERGRRPRAPMERASADSAVSIRCPSALVAALRTEALAHDCTMSAIVRRLLWDGLGQERPHRATRSAPRTETVEVEVERRQPR